MVTHIVIFTWVVGTTVDQVEGLSRALAQMASQMSDIVTISHGADLRFREGNGDYALIATFADRAGWDAYQADPRHKAFVRDFVTPLQATRLTIQF